MEYIQGLNAQTRIFFYSLGFGFLLGILYDVFRTVRLIISNSKSFVIFMDLLYFAVCSFLIFCFNMVVDSGRIRIYVILGESLGWLIYYFSFGAIAIRAGNSVKRIAVRLMSVIFKPFKRVFAFVKRKNYRLVQFFKKILRKNEKKTKFILQKHKGIVYNLKCYIENSVIKKRKG